MLFPVLLALLTSLVAPRPARAEAMPWVTSAPGPNLSKDASRLFVLDDAYVEMALRIDLIRHARHSIRIAVYHQTVDHELGLPILQALRQAAARGVRIQLVTGRVPAMMYDRDDLILKMLTDSSLLYPAQVVEFGGPSNRGKGWNISDSMHEKIFLIDDEVAILGGRNHGQDYLHWLDFGALITEPGAARRKGLVAEIRRAFNELWFDMASFAEPTPPVTVRPGDLPAPDAFTEVSLTPAQKRGLREAQAWLASARRGENQEIADEREFRPARARVISHRFFQWLATGLYNGESRLGMPDEIVDELVRLLDQGGREIRMSTLFVLFNPRLKAALKAALARGATLYIHFNGDTSARETVPLALSYKDSLGDLLELMSVRQASGEPARVRVAVLKQGTYRYLHRKLFIIDDHVFFGSHNYNLPSTIANSEVSVEVQDPAFAEAMTLAYDHDFMFSGRPLTMKEAADDYDSTAVTRWLAKFVEGFF